MLDQCRGLTYENNEYLQVIQNKQGFVKKLLELMERSEVNVVRILSIKILIMLLIQSYNIREFIWKKFSRVSERLIGSVLFVSKPNSFTNHYI